MTRRLRVIAAGLCLAIGAGAACGGGQEPAPAAGTPAQPAGTPAPAAGQSVAIAYRIEPDPPTSGSNAIEVTVTGADGAPVTDAEVTAVFSMPAMPSMNMPAMRSDATLTHEAGGRYRGNGDLSMGGTWNVLVTVARGPEELGSRSFSIVAQ